MNQPQAAQTHKLKVQQTFEMLAGTYDNPATRFFAFCADRLLGFVRPRSGSKVLDVATGTGAVAVPFAQAVGEAGRVAGIDNSSPMLARAEANIRKMALNNIDLFEMDAERLDFKTDYFDYVVCSYGLFFLHDMEAALREWVRVLRPGGTLAFTTFEESAFSPYRDNFVETLKAFGVQLPREPYGSRRISSLAHCASLLEQAGLTDIQVECRQIGYHLRDEKDWWEVVTSTAMRTSYEKLPEADREAFLDKHLAYVTGCKTDDGLWLDVETRFARGIKPPA